MKPSYIILTETGERLDLCNAEEFNPNEYAWKELGIGFSFCEYEPDGSYCYRPDYDERFIGEDGIPTTAHTILFEAYDQDGNMICEDTDHVTSFWL